MAPQEMITSEGFEKIIAELTQISLRRFDATRGKRFLDFLKLRKRVFPENYEFMKEGWIREGGIQEQLAASSLFR